MISKNSFDRIGSELHLIDALGKVDKEKLAICGGHLFGVQH
jgi:hypothetical protein